LHSYNVQFTIAFRSREMLFSGHPLKLLCLCLPMPPFPIVAEVNLFKCSPAFQNLHTGTLCFQTFE